MNDNCSKPFKKEETVRKQGLVITVLFIVSCLLVSVPSVFAWGENDQAQVPQPQAQVPPQPQGQGAVLPGGVKAYDGEITDEMIESFLRADAKIRALRQQISQITQQILQDEKVQPEVYMTIAQKIRQDQVFLEKVRAKAATMAEANATATATTATATEGNNAGE
jgi:hypothetical protein